MLAFSEWVLRAKRKKKKDEQRSSETYRESGNINHQGEVAGGHQTQPSKAIFIFPVPDQR
jgi:hypothetical protein